MTTLSFDTLKLARRLENAGFSSKQAGDTAEALAESLRETSDLATKQDLIELRAATKADIAELRAATKADIAALRAATKADITELRAATKADITELRAATKADIADLRATTKTDISGLKADIADLRSELYRALWLQAAGIVGVLSAAGALLKVWS